MAEKLASLNKRSIDTKTVTFTASSSTTVTPQGVASVRIPITKPAGYKILGVVGVSTGNTVVSMTFYSVGDTEAYVGVFNTYTGSSATVTPTITVLFGK